MVSRSCLNVSPAPLLWYALFCGGYLLVPVTRTSDQTGRTLRWGCAQFGNAPDSDPVQEVCLDKAASHSGRMASRESPPVRGRLCVVRSRRNLPRKTLNSLWDSCPTTARLDRTGCLSKFSGMLQPA